MSGAWTPQTRRLERTPAVFTAGDFFCQAITKTKLYGVHSRDDLVMPASRGTLCTLREERWMIRPHGGTFISILFLLLTFAVQATPTNLTAVRGTVVYADSRPGMNSDKKQKLQIIASGKAVNPSFFLQTGERVKVTSPTQFDVKETMADPKTGEAFKEMKVVYRCGLAEVLEGPNKGKKGWIVISREVVGRYMDAWYEIEKVEPETPSELE